MDVLANFVHSLIALIIGLSLSIQFYCISSDICLLLPVSGPCTNNILRWYYNYAVKRCQQFTYGGCDGNQNNFETLYNCLQQCGRYFNLVRID